MFFSDVKSYLYTILLILLLQFIGFFQITCANLGTSSQIDLEPINGTLNFRIYGKKGKDDKPWFDGRGLDMRHIQCVRRGRCEKLSFNTCLDAKIPYEYTSLDLSDSEHQKEVTERLHTYRALRHIPKCWAVIQLCHSALVPRLGMRYMSTSEYKLTLQPFLCSVFVPKCEQINGQDMVYLPSLEMCRITLEPCRILYHTKYFPEFLRCNETFFPTKCSSDVREMKFNVTSRCLEPLVSADSNAGYYNGIEGCGIQCNDPLYTNDEHRQIHKLIAWGACVCLLANFFVVVTFLIDWENANKYPAVIVFYINLCFSIVWIGFLAQFTPGSREDIVCRKDGTLRQSEPTSGENLSCIIVFVLVYYFSMAAMMWFVFLTYAWHLRAVGNVQDRIDKKGSYFHLFAWSLPLVLTITTMALSEVDGNSTVGICFVGYRNHPIRALLLLGPLCGIILVAGYFIVRGMIMLFGLKHFANDIKSISASNKIHLIIVRMCFCATFELVFILVAIACDIVEFIHKSKWESSLLEYVICRISSTFTDEPNNCKIENRPSVALLQLHLICVFGASIVMSTWCWTSSSLDTWKRYIRRKCGKDIVEEVKMPKHKVIAQTWAKRKEFEDKGRLSIALYNTHTDPVGLNFDVNDLNSSETNEISSTWANYLPQFVKRRMALTGACANNSSSQGPRKNSLDSEISFSVRHVSVESRRNSVDSQVSVKIAEMKTKVASRSRNHHHGKHSSSLNKRSQRRRDFIASATGHRFNSRRESSTSIESQVIALEKTKFPSSKHRIGLFTQSAKKHNYSNGGVDMKNSKRRTAYTDPSDINSFLSKNGQFIIPFLKNQGMTTSSDEEASITSFKVQDSRFDELKQELSDDNDNRIGSQRIAKIHGTLETSSKRRTALHNFLKSVQKLNESTNKSSRNSLRSRQCRKIQTIGMTSTSSNRRSQRKIHKNKSAPATSAHIEDDQLNISDLNLHFTRDLNDDDKDSITSYSSAELGIPLNVMFHSSFSGVSTGKPNSRNSKASCDVGIQANAYEIATQIAIASGEDEVNLAKRQRNTLNHRINDYNTNLVADATEMHMLLDDIKHRDAIIMSESEKLKILLLPSK